MLVFQGRRTSSELKLNFIENCFPMLYLKAWFASDPKPICTTVMTLHTGDDT